MKIDFTKLSSSMADIVLEDLNSGLFTVIDIQDYITEARSLFLKKKMKKSKWYRSDGLKLLNIAREGIISERFHVNISYSRETNWIRTLVRKI